jgi:formate dehydrogenase iron-sulfur subunit
VSGGGVTVIEAPAWPSTYGEDARPRVGFFTDTSICIGCKACEVACKEWNHVPATSYELTGHSYDNTGDLGADTWRHVAFVEQRLAVGGVAEGAPDSFVAEAHRQEVVERSEIEPERDGEGLRWLMSSDVCKHCTHAACLDVCPTGALFRTECGTVVVQEDVCNGCGYCVPACPFGVLDRREGDGRVWKCTLCYDRLVDDLEPACAKACPTNSIQFGEHDELRARRSASSACDPTAWPRLACTARTRATGWAAAAPSSCCSTSRRSMGSRPIRSIPRATSARCGRRPGSPRALSRRECSRPWPEARGEPF